MIPLGYLLKAVVPPPAWIVDAFGDRPCPIEAVYSVSHCISANMGFDDGIAYDKINGWWFYDAPETVGAAAAQAGADPASLTLFYYEALEEEFDEDAGAWRPIAPAPQLATAVRPPAHKTLCGYDVVTFTMGTMPECSPLSCCELAAKVPVNRFCLIDDVEAARALVPTLSPKNSEPGPYRILAVYRLEPPEVSP